MQIEIKIDEQCREPKVIIMTDRITDEVNGIIKKLSVEAPRMLVGFRRDSAEILDQAAIIRAYAQTGKVCAVTEKGEYTLRLRLYELEERLDRKSFVRISNSEIVNLSHVKGFDLSFTGTICVELDNGTTAFVSRRYVSKIKQVLGI